MNLLDEIIALSGWLDDNLTLIFPVNSLNPQQWVQIELFAEVGDGMKG
jgi:hypothetical protein